MSSIPVRRTIRVTRSTKDNENANGTTRASSRVASRAKSSVVSTGGNAGIARPTLSSKAKTTSSNEPASKEPTGTKRKREALLEVTTQVTNRNAGGMATSKTEGKASLASAGAKARTTVKPSGSRSVRLPLGDVAGRRERVVRAGSESAASSRTDTESASALESKTSDEKMEVDDVPTSLPKVQEENEATAHDDGEIERVFKRRHTGIEDSQADADRIAAELQATELSPIRLWDDLDAEDWDDPLMVSEYVEEVCDYLKEIELATMPRPDYMKDQSEITWEHRATLVDWLLQVHAKFGLLQESLFLTVNLIDRFLGLRAISLPKLQLVGLACFFIATKYEETYAPSVKNIAELADGLYKTDEILKAEKYILKILEWDLRAPGPLGWLRRGSKADNCEVHARTVAKYLIEISCLERTLIGVVPSLVSAAALWLGRLTLGREVWTANLEHYTTYSEQELLPIASVMLEYIITDPIPHESLYKKYAHKRYKRCSLFMRQWSLSRWVENGIINLGKEVEDIKAEVREIRASMEADES